MVPRIYRLIKRYSLSAKFKLLQITGVSLGYASKFLSDYKNPSLSYLHKSGSVFLVFPLVPAGVQPSSPNETGQRPLLNFFSYPKRELAGIIVHAARVH